VFNLKKKKKNPPARVHLAACMHLYGCLHALGITCVCDSWNAHHHCTRVCIWSDGLIGLAQSSGPIRVLINKQVEHLLARFYNRQIDLVKIDHILTSNIDYVGNKSHSTRSKKETADSREIDTYQLFPRNQVSFIPIDLD